MTALALTKRLRASQYQTVEADADDDEEEEEEDEKDPPPPTAAVGSSRHVNREARLPSPPLSPASQKSTSRRCQWARQADAQQPR